jgi:hypothetical protein
MSGDAADFSAGPLTGPGLLELPLFALLGIAAGLAVQDPGTPYWVMATLAFLSGFGGGNFASSMANISFFYPKRLQGYAMGMNGGAGDFGTSVVQMLVPLAILAPVRTGIVGGSQRIVRSASQAMGGRNGRSGARGATWPASAGGIRLGVQAMRTSRPVGVARSGCGAQQVQRWLAGQQPCSPPWSPRSPSSASEWARCPVVA